MEQGTLDFAIANLKSRNDFNKKVTVTAMRKSNFKTGGGPRGQSRYVPGPSANYDGGAEDPPEDIRNRFESGKVEMRQNDKKDLPDNEYNKMHNDYNEH